MTFFSSFVTFAVPALLDAARSYMSQQTEIEAILKNYDRDQSGSLDISELLKLLRDISPKGITVRAGDLLWLLSKCDLDDNCELTVDELLPAVGLWRDMALQGDDEPEDQDSDQQIIDDVMENLADGDEPVPLQHPAAPSTITYKTSAEYRPSAKVVPLNPQQQRSSERIHRYQGAVIRTKGVQRSMIRTMSGTHIVVSNSELETAKSVVSHVRAKRAGVQSPSDRSGCCIVA
jgi:Ca2+-binding EF-hand superfamily protein